MKAALIRAAVSSNRFCPPLYEPTAPRHLSPQLTLAGRLIDKPFPLPTDPKKLPSLWACMVILFRSLADYVYPDRSNSSALAALIEQCLHQRIENPASELLLSAANHTLEDVIPESTPFPFMKSGRLPTFQEFMCVVYDMAPDAVPGYPAVMYGRNKKQLILDDPFEVYEAVCLRFLSLQYLPSDSTPLYKIRHGMQGYVSVSIKNEPIKVGKQPRLVFPVDLVDEVLDRLFFTPFFSSLKSEWGESFSCIGIGFSKLDCDVFLSAHDGTPMATNDSPKFDVTRTPLEEILDYSVAIASYGGVHPKIFHILSNYCLNRRHSAFIVGELIIVQRIPGMMKSGEGSTSIFNTISRSRRSIAVDLAIRALYTPLHTSRPRAAGDDCTETSHPEKEQTYHDLGFTLRDYQDVNPQEGVDFCSHRWFPGEAPYGSRITKSLTKLVHGPATSDQILAFRMQYRRDPRFRLANQVIALLQSATNTNESTATLDYMSRRKTSSKKSTPKTKTQIVLVQKPRKKYAPRKQRPKNSKLIIPKSVMERVCGLSDPFCQSARRTKYPDGSICPTTIWALHNRFQLPSDANGAGAALILPSFNFHYATPTVITGGTCTFVNCLAFNNPYNSNTVEEFRLNSIGVVIHCLANANSVAGMLRLRLYTVSTGTPLLSTSIQSMNNAFAKDVPLKDVSSIAYVIPALDETSHNFHVPNSIQSSLALAALNQPSHATLQIGFDGMTAATGCLDIEVFYNYEVRFSDSIIEQSMMTPSPPRNAAVADAADYVSTQLATYVATSAESMTREVAKQASSYLNRTAATLGNTLEARLAALLIE
jgi:hypothetical protein